MSRRPRRARLRSKMGADVSVLVLSQVAALGISFALTPFQLHAMGAERYGIVAVTASLLSYLSFFDIGVGWALTHFVPYYRAAGEEDDLRRLIFSGLVTSVTIGTVGCALIWSLSGWAAHRLLGLHPDVVESAKFSIRMAALGFPILLTTSVFAGVGRGLGLFTRSALIRFLTFGLLNIAWAAVARSPRAIELVSLTQVILSALGLGWWILLVRARFPSPLTLRTYDKVFYRKLLSYGLFSSITSLGYLLINAADKLVLAVLLPIQNLVFYAIPFAVASQVPVVSLTVALVLFPRFSAAAGRTGGDGESADESARMAKASRQVLAVFNAFAVCGAVMVGPLALEMWLGSDFARHGAIPLQALVIGFGLLALGSVDQVYLQAQGDVRTSAGIFLLSGLGGLLGLIGLAPHFGVAGASIATASGFAFLGVGNIVAGARARKESPLTVMKATARACVVVGGACVAAFIGVKATLLFPPAAAIPLALIVVAVLIAAIGRSSTGWIRTQQRELAASARTEAPR